MSTDVVYSAVRTFLETHWTATELRWENEGQDPPGRTPWIAVEVAGNTFDQASIGTGIPADDRWREEGQVWCHVFVPTGTGSLTARQHATALVELFQGLQLDPDIEFRDISVGLGAPGSEDGAWWRLSVSIEWIRG